MNNNNTNTKVKQNGMQSILLCDLPENKVGYLDFTQAQISAERKMLSYLLRSENGSKYFDSMAEHIFSNITLKEIFKIGHEYYKTFRIGITQDVFTDKINKMDDSLEKEQMKDTLVNIYSISENSDERYFNDEMKKRTQISQCKDTMERMLDHLKEGDIEKVNSEFLNFYNNKYSSADVNTLSLKDVDSWAVKDNRNTIPTSWDYLNNIMHGGLGKGELGVIVGSSGAGKSWLLSAIAIGAARNCKNVLHASLELSGQYSMNRYGSILTGVDSNNIYENKDIVNRETSKLGGNLQLMEFREKIDVDTLRAIVKKYSPDLLIVDYADLLSSVSFSSENKYLEQGEVYTELRFLAGELQIPIWTASQSNRGNKDRKYIDDFDIADSYKKLMIADFVMSIFRSSNDKQNNLVAYKIIKNRFGYDGLIFKSQCDFSKGIIEVFPLDTTKVAQKYITESIMNTVKLFE